MKKHKLTEVEQKHLKTLSNIRDTLNSWLTAYQYLIKLIDVDRQFYVDTVIRPRLKISEELNIEIDQDKGTVHG